MKSIARAGTCNWDRRQIGPNRVIIGGVTALLTVFASFPVFAAVPQNSVPLPRARPPEVVSPQTLDPAAVPSANPEMPNVQKPEVAVAPPSACRLALTADLAVAPDHPDINDAGGCGGTDLVKLEAVVLPDRRKAPLHPAAILRCSMARAVVDWVRSDLTAIAASMNTGVSGLDNFNSYECRGRNRVSGAKLSEHGKANALDLRQIKLTNGASIALTDSFAPREPREKVLASICGRFDTVLGPGSDGYHEDHIHIDLAARRNGYKICQWAIEEGMPQRAPLLPVARPSDAPTSVASVAAVQPERGKAAPEPEPAAPKAASPGAPIVLQKPEAPAPQFDDRTAVPRTATPLPVPAPPEAKLASVVEPAPAAPRSRKPRKRNDRQTLPSPLQLFQLLR